MLIIINVSIHILTLKPWVQMRLELAELSALYEGKEPFFFTLSAFALLGSRNEKKK